MATALWIVGVIAALLVLLLIYAATKPNEFTLLRRIRINAPPEKVQALIDDFRAWQQWSPWEKMATDGELKRSYGGAARGLGSSYAWLGKKTGGGGAWTSPMLSPVSWFASAWSSLSRSRR